LQAVSPTRHPRPLPGLQPATVRWRAFDCRSAGRSRSCTRRHRQPSDFSCPLPGTAPPSCPARSVGIIRTAHSSPSRIMPRHRHPTATARGWRRFGLPASAPDQARLRSLPRPAPFSASARRHPRPGERSSCRFGGSQPLLAALTTLPACLGFAPATQAGTRQPFGVARLSASTAPASFLAGGGSRLAADNRSSRQKKAAAVSLLRLIILCCARMRTQLWPLSALRWPPSKY